MTIQAIMDSAEELLRQKYVVRADDRQKAMGLSYLEAETKDLAKTVADFVMKEMDIIECPKCSGFGQIHGEECDECWGKGGVSL